LTEETTIAEESLEPEVPAPVSDNAARVVAPGDTKGRPTIELRSNDDGTNEAFLVPRGATPVPSGIALVPHKGKLGVYCRIRKKVLAFKPEEVVRQMILNWLIDDLSYPENHVVVEYPVHMGSAVHDKPADIVVFADEARDRAWMIVEVKQPTRKDGVEQLKSYMNAEGALFGYWTNGVDKRFLLRSDPNDFSKPIWRLPAFGESLSDIDEPLTKARLEPVKDLYAVFKDIEQEILAHQTVDTFNEIFKIVFAKLFDERTNLAGDKSVAKFRLGLTEDPTVATDRVLDLFEKAKAKWRDVYEPGETIQLNQTNIAYCIKALQQYHLIRSGDVLGVAFELLVNQEMKGEMGQYFTPRQVVDMVTRMMAPSIDETVCDPACGSGGFLIYAMRHVFEYINTVWEDPDDRAEQRKDYAQDKLLGMDNDQRLVRVAKAYMIMENDGRGGIRSVDSLDYTAWDKDLKKAVLGRSTKPAEAAQNRLTSARQPTDGVDIVLTNPPFAGAIKAVTTLRQYDLAVKDAKGSLKPQLVRAELFLERCLDILRPGGRMAIVLPQGILNNIGEQGLRDFVDDKARVLAVVGLHPYTFKPFTLAKTSVLFLQKWLVGEERPTDYPIFTAVSMRPGKTKLGRPQYLDDGRTLDCDMSDVAEAFVGWATAEGLAFATD
jgi:type I restriction enzyme M protein